jgi:hypothetical protein
MKPSLGKTIQKPWFFPLALLLIGGIAYGLIIPALGFYWDDWEGVYLYYMHNPAISSQYYSARPIGAIVYLILFPIAKMTPIVWQIVALLLRWGGILFVYYTLNLIWPLRQQLNRWTAALLFVFPGFLEQPVSVAFSQHLMTYLFFTCSLFLMVLALKKPKLFWLWMPISILFGGLQIFMMEYFVGLEIIRPILIWFTLRSGQKDKSSKILWKTFLYWSPFLLVLLAYLYWRLAYLPSTLATDPNNPILLKSIIEDPLTGLSDLVVKIYQDSLTLLLYVWPKSFLDPSKMDISTKRVWISWLCGAFACVAFSLYNKYSRTIEQDDDHTSAQLFFLGIVALLFGAMPFWATGDQISGGKWSERFTLAPMLGAVILVVTLIDWLFRTHKQKNVLLTILLGVSISGQFFNQVVFRNDWEKQRSIYWQLHWRVPSLKAGTALFGRGTFTDKSSYYDGFYTVNLLLDGSARYDPNYGYFDINHLGLDDYVPGIALTQSFNSIQFQGNTSQAIVFDFSVRGSCVRVLDSIYQDDPDLSSSVADLFDISDVSNIQAAPDLAPMPAIFGSAPPPTWCYYFEKADLARQMQDWETILQLKAEADARGYGPDLAAEYFPFIEAYAQTNQWEQAHQLSLAAQEIGSGSGMALCNLWRRYAQLDTNAEMRDYIEKSSKAFCSLEKL